MLYPPLLRRAVSWLSSTASYYNWRRNTPNGPTYVHTEHYRTTVLRVLLYCRTAFTNDKRSSSHKAERASQMLRRRTPLNVIFRTQLQQQLSRGATVVKTHDGPKKTYIPLFLHTTLGPDYLLCICTPVMPANYLVVTLSRNISNIVLYINVQNYLIFRYIY